MPSTYYQITFLYLSLNLNSTSGIGQCTIELPAGKKIKLV